MDISTGCRQGIVPPYLLRQLALSTDEALAVPARTSLLIDDGYRRRRDPLTGVRPPTPRAAVPQADDGTGPRRTISDAGRTTELPGLEVRGEGAPATGDAACDEAYDGLGATWALFSEVYGRDSLDDAGLPLDATVHYGVDYDNAFWDGSRMVFGDGDGRVFGRFTQAVDVIGHELTHGVTEKAAALVYRRQSGALNESVSDVFGSLVKQRLLGQDAATADWLIGAGLFAAGVQGVALRSMKAPGTAYDDPVLGRDPQPATMAGYVETDDDNGGVHINSGIPNHAFHLAAIALGGRAWDGVGHVWYDVLTGGELAADADFVAFARLTVQAAVRRFGQGSEQAAAVSSAWDQVGVRAGAPAVPVLTAPAADPLDDPEHQHENHQHQHDHGHEPASAVLKVGRSGGVTGLRLERELTLAELPAEQADQWLTLARSGVLQGLQQPDPAADRYVYRVWSPDLGLDVVTGEQALPPGVRDTLEQTLRPL
jgi:hypothetical protein